MKKFAIAAMALAATLGLGGSAFAQPRHLEPGSVLVFPLVDSKPASTTLINITNTNQDRATCGNGFRQGDVLLHYVYYGKQADGSTVCLEFDRYELLTPADTLSVMGHQHNPEMELGFLTVSALDPESESLIDFDFLIGSAYVANANLDIMWSYTPYPFEAVAGASGGTDNCGRDFVRNAGDVGPIVFDDTDYVEFPDILYLDSFFQEEEGMFDNSITLMSTSGQDYINELDLLFFNNKEDVFSRTFKFVCHTTVKLSDLSSIASSLGGDPTEFAVETGWLQLDGRNILDLAGNRVTSLPNTEPSILGVFVQVVMSDFTAGHALHYTGTQPAQLP